MKLAFIDADDTLWQVEMREKGRREIGIISMCTPPFRREDDVLIDRSGRCRVHLFPEAREAINSLKEKGYTNIVLSINFEDHVKEAVRAFNLDVDGVVADIDIDKGAVIKAADELMKPERIVVIDDLAKHINVPKKVKKYSSLLEAEEDGVW